MKEGSRQIRIRENLEEICEHGSLDFPVLMVHDHLWEFPNGFVTCHWHPELELSIVLTGRAEYRLNQQTVELKAGEGVLINSNTLHSSMQKKGERVTLCTLIVHPSFLFGTGEGVLGRRYAYPFTKAEGMEYILLRPQIPWEEALLQKALSMYEAFQNRHYGYEMYIKGIFCQLIYEIMARREQILTKNRWKKEDALRRLAVIYDYIHTHYAEPIRLEELAAKIPLSTGECCRFFKKTTNMTIGEYITDYRILKSLELLEEGACSIGEIASRVGFSSASRFSSSFKEKMNCLPKDYEKRLV